MTQATALQRRRATFFGVAAWLWSLLFAAISFYWALGGTAGSETIGPAITDLAQDPAFVTVLWIIAVLKVLLGLLALALILPLRGIFAWRVLHGLLRAAGWAAGIGMALYGGASFVQHALMLSGAIPLPSGLGETAATWHLFLWDPWWMLGGILFVGTVWFAGGGNSPESGRVGAGGPE